MEDPMKSVLRQVVAFGVLAVVAVMGAAVAQQPADAAQPNVVCFECAKGAADIGDGTSPVKRG
jgi:hypothetical protein